MTLRIAWLGPWNVHSSIATFGALIVAELSNRGHTVDIFRSETGSSALLPELPAARRVQRLGEIPAHVLQGSYDAVLANLGDNFAMHGAILPYLQKVPLLLILHDLFLANLAAGWAATLPDGETILRTMVRETYGNAALPAKAPYWTDFARMVAERPLVEYFASFGYGAIVHAHHYETRVRTACLGPVVCVPVVAYVPPDIMAPQPIRDTLTIVTIGHVNRNKQAAEVITAIAALPTLRQSVRYRLIGPVEDSMQRELLDLAARLGVSPPIFTGWASDDDLRRHIEDADVICCLRNPVLEGSSGSMVLGLMSERPTLVSNHGCYAEIPDGLVLKCRPGAEAADVAAHLNWVLSRPESAADMGRRAARFARAVYNPVPYTDGVLRLIEQATPRLPGILAGLAIGRVLGSFGMARSDPAATRAADALADLLDEH
jgi:glycosyltransferase involved in cell wall biosynthesis